MAKVTVYSRNNCMQCKMTKRFLTEHHVDFIEHNINDDPQYKLIISRTRVFNPYLSLKPLIPSLAAFDRSITKAGHLMYASVRMAYSGYQKTPSFILLNLALREKSEFKNEFKRA